MVSYGLIREEVDLLEGRVPANVFIRRYWTFSFQELRDRTLKAVNQLNKNVLRESTAFRSCLLL